MKLARLSRAEYVCRPLQLVRRAWRLARRLTAGDEMTVTLPWGLPITVDPRESIGRSIVALSTLDLPVTETIWRLLDDGERAVDVGANVGYMTAVMAARLRTGGEIWSFEPMPALAARLQENVDRWRSRSGARFAVCAEGLSNTDGPGRLQVSAEFAENHGTASLVHQAGKGGSTVAVTMRRFDGRWGDAPVAVMKVDVEGAEAQVFRGAERLIRTHRVRDIVFEEHAPVPTESVSLLQAHGYTIWRVTRGRCGPQLLPAETHVRDELDPPTYLASIEPDRVRRRFAATGWLSLRF